MSRLGRILLAIPIFALFLQIASGQTVFLSPISLTSNQEFTATVLGTNLAETLFFQYLYDSGTSTVPVLSPTSTAVFTFIPGELQLVFAYDSATRFLMGVLINPTESGANSVGFLVPPVSLGQKGVTATVAGNVKRPLPYTIANFANSTSFTTGILPSGVSKISFNAPASFQRLLIGGESAVAAYVSPFLGITVSPSPILTEGSFVLSVTALADPTASITYVVVVPGTTTFVTVLPPGSTEYELPGFPIPSVYGFSAINGLGFASMSFTVVDTPFIAQPTPGTLLPAGSSVTAIVTGYNTASDCTLSFGNGVFALITTLPAPISTAILPIPSNYIGQLYLTASQGTITNVATYTVSVAQAILAARGLRRRANLGR